MTKPRRVSKCLMLRVHRERTSKRYLDGHVRIEAPQLPPDTSTKIAFGCVHMTPVSLAYITDTVDSLAAVARASERVSEIPVCSHISISGENAIVSTV